MKLSKLLLGILTVAFLFYGTNEVYSQSSGKKKKKKTTTRSTAQNERPELTFVDRLWYGSNATFNLWNGNTSSRFVVGLSPYVGYKITPEFSIGPTLSFAYILEKATAANNQVIKFSGVNFGFGPFTRYVFLPKAGIFVHGEYVYTSYEVSSSPTRVEPGTLKIATERIGLGQAAFGFGYNPSFGLNTIGYDILILYLIDYPYEVNIPIEFRVGITIKF